MTNTKINNMRFVVRVHYIISGEDGCNTSDNPIRRDYCVNRIHSLQDNTSEFYNK